MSRLPLFDNGIAGQTSTYDRTGGNNDGFAGTYSFIRRNLDSSLVIFEAKGSGVITRIATPTPTNDTLDIYINDTIMPSLSVQYNDLFTGKVFPFVKPLCGSQLGGFYCYYPIMFNNGCKIVCRAKNLQFHQIQYKRFPKGTVVQSFTKDLTDNEKGVLEKIVASWGNCHAKAGSLGSNLLKQASAFTISPGETKTIFDRQGGGRVTGIELDNADAFVGLYKNIDIKISWDGETTPAVYCPIADFFGYAFGSPAMQSLLVGTNHNKNYCYYPMPFVSTAKVQLIYRNNNQLGSQPTKRLTATVYYTLQKRDVQKEGKFYTCWQGNATPAAGQPHTLLKTKGRGQYVGTLLQAQGLRPGMTLFFEGDDSTAVDGQPAIHGTGSEDYFNGGWYAFPDRWSSRCSLPLHGALEYNLPYCRTGGYRLYMADKIPFTKSIYQSMEHGPDGNTIPASYTTLAFYYCDTPPTQYTKPNNADSKVFIPDTLMLYPQLLTVNIWGQAAVKPTWAYNTGGESFIFTVNDGTRLKFSVGEILPGRYQLFADFTKFPEGCDFSIWQRQCPVGGWIPTYAKTKERVSQLYLGSIAINDTENTLTIQFKTNRENNSFFLNRFILVKQ